MVRGFARYAHGVDPRHEVPPQGLLPERYRRRQPYLYRDTEIAELIAAARELSATTGLRPLTYATMLGLLSVTGMRTGEILKLDRDDVDLANGVLTVREAKFGKSRHIPLHGSTGRALGRYAARRDRLCRNPRDPAFFLNESGTRITESTLRWTFVRLSRQTGLPGTRQLERPRPPAPRHAPLVRRRHAGAVVPGGRRRRAPHPASGDLARPCPCERHLLVSLRHSGTDAGRRQTARPHRTEAAAMKAAADFPRLLAMSSAAT